MRQRVPGRAIPPARPFRAGVARPARRCPSPSMEPSSAARRWHAARAHAGRAPGGAARSDMTADSIERRRLQRALEVHVTQLGYSCAGPLTGIPLPEMVRISPGRRRMIYGETVTHRDLRSARCHERLLFFSQRRTRHRGSILFFIGVATTDQQELEALLVRLDIRRGIRGGHVHVVPVPPLQRARRPVARSRTNPDRVPAAIAPDLPRVPPRAGSS